jgi:hypothetical protein
MPKGEAPNLSEQEAEECMHCAIIDMVEEKIAQAVRMLQASLLS